MNRSFYIIITCMAVFSLGFYLEKEPRPYKFPELNSFPKIPQSPDNPVTVEGVELGRYLFYDPILSGDSTMSCSSCHKQGYAFSDAPNQFSEGRNKELMKRNTLPLFNLAWYNSFFWDGRAATLEDQVLHPVRTETELNLKWNIAEKRIKRSKFYKPLFKKAYGKTDIDSTLIARSIAQFLRTLISHNSKYDKALRKETKLSPDELEGFEIVNDMTRAGCVHCHTTDQDPLGTIRDFSNNGLDMITDPEGYKDKGLGQFTKNTKDNGKFKIPSLRNIVFTAPYMHDGRFKTIEEVVNFYSEEVKPCANIDSRMEFAHQGGPKLNIHEKRKVIAFLKTLSDSAFITNPEFSDPFLKKKNN
jgi:cytochrome c peroxidase